MDSPPGLRERKKAATRLALHEAAVRLAVEHGVDNVTVEAIADAVDVSRRTFSNYFGGKEEALLYGDRVRLARLLDLVRARPAGEPPWTAMTRAVAELSGELSSDPGWSTQMYLLRRHPSLLPHHVTAHAASERGLAEEVARRLGGADGDGERLRARLLAAVFLSALRTAVSSWREERPDETLAEIMREALQMAREPFE